MKQKFNVFNKVVITVLFCICALLPVAIVGVSAATVTSTHTVSLSSVVGDATSYWITMTSKAKCTENFSSYPTIYNGYTYSKNKARAEYEDGETLKAYKSFTLQDDYPAPVTVTYGNLKKGDWLLYYKHTADGGFSCKVTTLKWYE